MAKFLCSKGNWFEASDDKVLLRSCISQLHTDAMRQAGNGRDGSFNPGGACRFPSGIDSKLFSLTVDR